jgi:hypothetical protein
MKMEKQYTIRIKEFNKDTQWFIVLFNAYFTREHRKITTCCIVEYPSNKIYSGATIKHPKDKSDNWAGRRWAYKRTVLMLYLIWSDLGKTTIGFNEFWQLFRKALAENKTYLLERITKSNG